MNPDDITLSYEKMLQVIPVWPTIQPPTQSLQKLDDFLGDLLLAIDDGKVIKYTIDLEHERLDNSHFYLHQAFSANVHGVKHITLRITVNDDCNLNGGVA